jgi:predicted PurR-regulated permease PerM
VYLASRSRCTDRSTDGSRARTVATVVIAVAVVLGALRIAQAVLIPTALAILLAFVLNPAVAWLERRLGRVLAVALVVAMSWVVVGGTTWAVARHVGSFAQELPQYRDQLKRRLVELRQAAQPHGMDELQTTVDDLLTEIQPPPERPSVRVEPPRPIVLGPELLLTVLASAGLVTLLVVFFLLERQQLRNRLLRLAGHGRLALTTKALEEASQRISRYLLAQATLNATFGLLAGLGLFAIGVPYAAAWGVLVAVLRFVPFLGFWIAALPPLLLSVATSDSWTQPMLVAGLFLALLLTLMFVVEPLVYGQGLGISRVAIVVGVAFWTWLWGPVGLVIATPLTVCLIVLGRHVPELRYLAVLIGDEPVLAPHLRVYQRLLAGDWEEASEFVRTALAAQRLSTVVDDILVPALSVAKEDRTRGALGDDDEGQMLGAMRRLVAELDTSRTAAKADGVSPISMVGYPAAKGFDEQSLALLRLVLEADGTFRMDAVSPDLPSSKVVSIMAERQVSVAVVAALLPDGITQVRQLCGRLRKAAPASKIVVLLLGRRDALPVDHPESRIDDADSVVDSITAAQGEVIRLAQGIRTAAGVTC